MERFEIPYPKNNLVHPGVNFTQITLTCDLKLTTKEVWDVVNNFFQDPENKEFPSLKICQEM